ncbi:hypothetical protein ACS0TY_010884 [Phlomoides rotata]
MADGDRTLKTSREEEDVVIIEGKDEDGNQALPLCLIGKVATGKPFNAFSFLEVMKRAMNPSKGFIATEIGPNLFSFQFKSHADLEEEIGEGEQPSAVAFKMTNMWVRMYDLPMAARSENTSIQSLADAER